HFFLLYLQQSPKALLDKNTETHANKVAQIQSLIAKHDKEIADTMELIGTLPIAELKTKLADLENKRQIEKGILDRLNHSMISTVNAPKALSEVKAIVSRLLKSKVQNINKPTVNFYALVNLLVK